jgi:hypothetical protein
MRGGVNVDCTKFILLLYSYHFSVKLAIVAVLG